MTLWLKSRKSRAAPEIRESFWPKAPPFVPFVELVMYVRGLESQSLHIFQGKVMRRLLYEFKPQGQTTWFPNQSPLYKYYSNLLIYKCHGIPVKSPWHPLKSPWKHPYISLNPTGILWNSSEISLSNRWIPLSIIISHSTSLNLLIPPWPPTANCQIGLQALSDARDSHREHPDGEHQGGALDDRLYIQIREIYSIQPTLDG